MKNRPAKPGGFIFADDLRARGHKVAEPLGQTSANSIALTDDGFGGAPDPRSRGAFAVGY